jgi:hypothetical protein
MYTPHLQIIGGENLIEYAVRGSCKLLSITDVVPQAGMPVGIPKHEKAAETI